MAQCKATITAMNFRLNSWMLALVLASALMQGCFRYGKAEDGRERQICRRTETKGDGNSFALIYYFVDGADSTPNFRANSAQNLKFYCSCRRDEPPTGHFRGEEAFTNVRSPLTIFYKEHNKIVSYMNEPYAHPGAGPIGNLPRFEMEIDRFDKWRMELEGEHEGHTYRYEFTQIR